MTIVRLIHWNAAEAEARAARIKSAGYEVACDLPAGPDFMKQMRQEPPLAVIIDLGRLPSQGRDIGVALRVAAATRRVPLVFVAGSPDKTERVRAVLPDAVFTTWEEIEDALAEAIRNPPVQPVVPESTMAGYSGQPLIKKLGIKAGMTVALLGAPDGFGDALGDLPAEVTLKNTTQSTVAEQGREPVEEPVAAPGGPSTGSGHGLTGSSARYSTLKEDCDGGCGVALWFVRSRAELAADLAFVAAAVGDVPLWIAWAKKASGLASDVAEQDVRALGLAAGLVDYKICAIDQTWSGLLFRRRK